MNIISQIKDKRELILGDIRNVLDKKVKKLLNYMKNHINKIFKQT